MMVLVYRLGLWMFNQVIHLAAFSGNEKADQWIQGRKHWEDKLKEFAKHKQKRYWFHCSSLGEFEQGRPLLEAFREAEPGCFILLTFFSPSGYQVRKNYRDADLVLYLPVDSPGHAKRFLDFVNPDLVFFIKYDYWYFYLRELKRRKIPVYFISAIFHPTQRFFRWYGSFFRKMLNLVTYFFVQDQQSSDLLKSIGLTNCLVSGDTRFDRVIRIAGEAKELPVLEEFKSTSRLLVAGSTWDQDVELLLSVYAEMDQNNVKLVLVPHEVSDDHLARVKKRISTRFKSDFVIYYSEQNSPKIRNAKILVVDKVGLLSSIYRHGSYAYIGGGFGKGIHNILEAAVYGMPVFFGPRYSRFNEAVDLVQCGGAFVIQDANTLTDHLKNFTADEVGRLHAGTRAGEYVRQKSGATLKILNRLKSG